MTNQTRPSQRGYKAIVILYFSIVFALLIVVIASIIGAFFGDIQGINIDDIQNNVFALILAGVTITLASSIILPRFLIEQTVKEEIEKKSDEIEEKLEAQYGTHINTTDAHLSRMIGYLLAKSSTSLRKLSEVNTNIKSAEIIPDYVWASGWALRSFKNYMRIADQGDVTGESVNIKNYEDLILITVNVMRDARTGIFEQIDINNLVSRSAKRKGCIDLARMSTVFKEAAIEEDWLSVHKRSVKESLDNEFMYGRGNYEFEIQKIAKRFFRESTPLNFLSLILIVNDAKKDPMKDIESLKYEIISRSSFKDSKDFGSKVEAILNATSKMIDKGITKSEALKRASLLALAENQS